MKNGNQNSRVEIILGVIRKLLDDIADLIELTLRDSVRFDPHRECDRDFAYIESRTRSEGIAFLTRQLPRLGKWYDEMLFRDMEARPPVGFKPHSRLLTSCGELACPVFTRMYSILCSNVRGWHQSGSLDPSCESLRNHMRVIRAYRSLFYLFYKYELTPSEEDLRVALQKWEAVEDELLNFEYPPYYDRDVIAIREILESLFHHAEHCFDRKVLQFQHGPGAVAGREVDTEKWETFHRYATLEKRYPWYDLYIGDRVSGRISPCFAALYRDFAKGLDRREYGVSRLLFVPKDSRGPRTISCEPKEFMYVQQGIARALMPVLTRASKHRINFLDQGVNAGLALESSVTGRLATVDMEDASDRVSWLLVKLTFPEWVLPYLEATRSSGTLLPDGRVHYPHQKYAPMGSALCFPMESALFWAVAVHATVTCGMDEETAKASVYVYGDDIVMPPPAVHFFVDLCQRLALKVNLGKTYAEGPFRESCGVDAYYGFDVTPLRIRRGLCSPALTGTLALGVCEYASECFARDYRKTGEYLWTLVNTRYPGVHRINRGTLGCLHVVDPLHFGALAPLKWNPRMCRLETTGWVLTTPLKPCELQGLGRLLRAYHGHWELHDPGTVTDLRSVKVRRRTIAVEGDWVSFVS